MRVTNFEFSIILIGLLFYFGNTYSVFRGAYRINFDERRHESILRETNIDSDVLIITFGGQGQDFVIPMYEFYTILKSFNWIDKINDVKKEYGLIS